ncbi:MAG: adenosylcobalamin-dependent ribonucleoside-diphosphate reductase [Candidatus Omnitrophica bacterium]|nr:adenosylcobalamin-dependent ribonucleoside-diphosphate reductase [Candidatus Omnitrophota bacterium]
MQPLTENAKYILKSRYLLKNEAGEVIETSEEMFKRVARHVAQAEKNYKSPKKTDGWEEAFFGAMSNLEFLPNSPTLMNAGTDVGQLSACFVLPVEDSIAGIFRGVHEMAIIHKSGGGTGFSFSHLRPKSDVVHSTGGVASGPISFMRVYDTSADVIKQGGRRRGANMGILRVDHPDIMEFIHAKEEAGVLDNFNLSVAVTDDFMKRARQDQTFTLKNPRTGLTVQELRARDIFHAISKAAHATGDPGLIFLDEINRNNSVPQLGALEATNPCGEQPLLAYESCNLGSINLSRLVENGEINWDKLEYLIELGVRFLDDVIDVNRYPVDSIGELTRANRKIGLGVMGFAEMLIQMNEPYHSEKALGVAEELMRFIEERSHSVSKKLGAERGSFPNFKDSRWQIEGYGTMRNATVTTIAPTGTIGLIAGTSSGIEPIFAVSYTRRTAEGTELEETDPYLASVLKDFGVNPEPILKKLKGKGTISDIKEVPEDVRKLFKTALEIPSEFHVRMQAAFQKYTDNAVSKTINLPEGATVEEVERAFMSAFDLHCKGITVYRYGTKKDQVLRLGLSAEETTPRRGPLKVGCEFNGDCRVCSV